MKRGELWWADIQPPWGRRPVVLLTRDSAYAYLTNVTVVGCTSTIRSIPVEVGLGPADGLHEPSVANLDWVLTIAKSRVETRISQLSEEKMRAIEEALHFALDLSL